MSIQEKYNALLAAGWTPAVPLPVVGLPVPGTAGQFFAYTLTTGVAVTIYHHPNVGTFEVHGAILAHYLATGGPRAHGFPVSDEMDDLAGDEVIGRVSHFQNGSIYYHAASGQVAVAPVAPSPTGTSFEIIDGVDVSHWNGDIDWSKVRQAGIGFAYMKATDGDTFTDDKFKTNWQNSKGVLPRGAYHFFLPRREPDTTRTQADHFVDIVASAGGGSELPPMVDVERAQPGVTADQAIMSLQFFLSIVHQATGQRPLIYTGRSFWKHSMNSSYAFSPTYQLWVASYGRPLGDGEFDTLPGGPRIPPGWRDYAVWQHAVRRGLPGINSRVDRDMVMLPAGHTLASFLA